MKGLLEKIHTLGKRCKLDTIFRSQNTLRSHLTSNKPKTQHDTKTCIYVIPCEYKQKYIDETERSSQICFKKHQNNTKHAWHRNMDNKEAKIIIMENTRKN